MEELRLNRRNFIKKTGIGLAIAGFGSIPMQLLASDDFITITILHTNDIHCHVEPFTSTNENMKNIGGLARISSLVKSVRKENRNTLLFDAGDMFQGTPYFNYFRGELILKLMSEIGYNAGTIGNHEFDNGLEGILEPLPNAKFPLINSNYDFSDTILNGQFPQWKIFEQEGIKVGVYGLGIDLKRWVSTKNYGNTIYNNPIKVGQEMESFLKNEKNCDLIVCLSHLGIRDDNQIANDTILAAETHYTDLIIGGHTHTYLEEPLFLKNKLGRQVIVNQAWWGGLVVGRFDFIFERSRKIRKEIYTAQL